MEIKEKTNKKEEWLHLKNFKVLKGSKGLTIRDGLLANCEGGFLSGTSGKIAVELDGKIFTSEDVKNKKIEAWFSSSKDCREIIGRDFDTALIEVRDENRKEVSMNIGIIHNGTAANYKVLGLYNHSLGYDQDLIVFEIEKI